MRRLFFILLIFWFYSNSIFGEDIPEKKTKVTSGYYIVTYKNTDLNLEISINGYKIKDGSSNEDSSGQEDINYWIMPDKNKLTYRITERKPTKKKSSFPLDPKAEINLVIGQKGEFPEDGERLLTFVWSSEEGVKTLGVWQELPFDPPFIPPSKLWTIAKSIEWSTELEKSAIAHLEALTKALNSKDTKQVLPFLTFREKDTAEARYYPHDPASDKKALEGLMKTIGPNWKLNKSQIKANLLCDNKIVELTDSKGHPILKGKKDAAIPIYLSLVDGKWMIVR